MSEHLREQWRRLAMPVDSPPEGMRWIHGNVPRYPGVAAQHMLQCVGPKGEKIGHIRWLTKDYKRPPGKAGEITYVFVRPEYRRRGIATLLLEKARSIDPRVHHSGVLTEDGEEWSQAVASRTAMPTSWRPVAETDPTIQADAVIITQFVGRRRVFEVYTYGVAFTNRSSLAEAQAAVEEVYGPLTWHRRDVPKVEVETIAWGLTTEFSDPTTVYVANLPRLGGRSASLLEVRQGEAGRGVLPTPDGSSDGQDPEQQRLSSLHLKDFYRASTEESPDQRAAPALLPQSLPPQGWSGSRPLRGDGGSSRESLRDLWRSTGPREGAADRPQSRVGDVSRTPVPVVQQGAGRLQGRSSSSPEGNRVPARSAVTAAYEYDDSVIRRGLCWALPDNDRGWTLAHKFADHTITAAEIVREIGRLGVWWGLESQYGGMEDYESHAESNFGVPVLTALREAAEEAEVDGIAPRQRWFGGDVALVFTARRPVINGKPWDPEEDNPPGNFLSGNSYLPDRQPLEIIEVRYDAGDGYRTLSASGIRATAVREGR